MPTSVEGIGAGVAQPTQPFQVPVADAAVAEEFAHRIAVKLGVMPGTGDGPHVHQTLDAVRPQQRDKFAEAARGMPHGVDCQPSI